MIIIPDNRITLLRSKFENDMIKERLSKDPWEIITYGKLKEFFGKNKKRKKIDVKEFLKISGIPEHSVPLQKKISEY